MPEIMNIKRKDRRPSVTMQAFDAAGNPVNFGPNATAKFIMTRRGDTTPTVNAPAAIVDAALGKLQYDWIEGDTDKAGVYNAEFEVTYGDGRKLTVPNFEYLLIIIHQDLG